MIDIALTKTRQEKKPFMYKDMYNLRKIMV